MSERRGGWRGRFGLERGDAVLLLLFAGMSVSILAGLATRPLSMTGAESGVVADQLQYFSWIRVASESVVIHNVWDIDPEGTSYFVHPGFLVAGLIHKLGLSIPLSYQILWKPVAVAVLFFGFRAYARRLLESRGARLAALAIALFYVSPVAAALDLASIGGLDFRKELRFLAGEVFPGVYVWGYLMTAIAVGLVPLVLLAAERARERGRYAAWAAAGALLISWLQPWQGVAVIATVAVVELIDARRSGARWALRARTTLPLLVAAVVPLVYYWILERVDPAWEIAGHANRKFELGWPPSVWLIGLLPLAIPAVLAYRRGAPTWQDVALRVLPFALVGEYFLISVSGLGTFPFHSLQGLSLPLAILAVQGAAEWRPAEWWRARAVPVGATLGILLALGVADRLDQIRIEIHKGGQPYLLEDGEVAAFDYLEHLPREGGVLAPIYSGLMVPYQTGRETWVGQLSWTPHYHERVARAEALFDGRLDGPRAARFVRSTRARFLFADCLARKDLSDELRDSLRSVRRFGCATVYELKAERGVRNRAGVAESALLFVLAAGLSALIIRKGMQPNDEGLMLQAASRIASGEVPYRDFWWFYPPGQPYLLAGLWKLFGPSLIVWRIVRVLVNGAVAVLAYWLARREAPRSIALVAWAVAAVALAAPTGPHPYPVALALAFAALLAFDRSTVLTGVLVGVCALWRLEFAAYLGVGLVAGYALRPDGRRLRSILLFASVSVATACVLFAPVVLDAGLSRSWDLLIRYPIEDFGDYQSLPFPLIYDGGFDLGSASQARDSISSVLSFEVPLLLMIELAAVLCVLALGFRRDRWRRVPFAVFSIGMAHYLITRPDAFHIGPLAITLAVPGAWIVADAREALRERGGLSPRARLALVPVPVIVLVLAWVLVDGLQRVERQIEEDMVPVDLAVADGVRELPSYNCSLPGDPHPQTCTLADLEAAVRYVRRVVPPGEPIYVGTRRSDLVTSGAPMLYVLTDRPSATRYDIAAPGVVTTAPVQREIVADLERRNRPLVIRWTASITAAPEPNRAGESTGVRILDRYLASRYRQTARFGSYVILEGREP